MNIVKVKQLSNHTKMVGFFSGETNDSVNKIKVSKYIYLKKNKGQCIEVESRLLKLSITPNNKGGYDSQVSFGNKTFDKVKHYNPKLSLPQIWKKPMSFNEIRTIVEAFPKNTKSQAINFTNLRTIQSAIKDDWESMQLFILSGEIKDSDEDYFSKFLEDVENQR